MAILTRWAVKANNFRSSTVSDITMWNIGIKSGLITVLGFVAYGLLVQLMGLENALWGNLHYVVLALGIYSGHYYYKAANDGIMSYKQGLKLGLIIITFTGCVNALPIYLYVKFIDASFIIQLTESIQETWQRKGVEGAIIEKAVWLMQHMPPILLSIGIFLSTVVLGFAFTLIIAAFSRHTQKISQT